jgi:hypothetical protein
MTMEELAELLVCEDLTKNIRTIKLMSCWSGTGGSEQGRATSPTALQLKRALVKRGFWRVKVYGYRGAVNVENRKGYPQPWETGGIKLDGIRLPKILTKF